MAFQTYVFYYVGHIINFWTNRSMGREWNSQRRKEEEAHDGWERRDQQLQPPLSLNRFHESDTRADSNQANHSLSHEKCMMLLRGPMIPNGFGTVDSNFQTEILQLTDFWLNMVLYSLCTRSRHSYEDFEKNSWL